MLRVRRHVSNVPMSDIGVTFDVSGEVQQRRLLSNKLIDFGTFDDDRAQDRGTLHKLFCDGGDTWIDVANFHFTTGSASLIYSLSSATPVTTEYTPTDGLLDANTSVDGIIGNLWRMKPVTTGTYADGTVLCVDTATGMSLFD